MNLGGFGMGCALYICNWIKLPMNLSNRVWVNNDDGQDFKYSIIDNLRFVRNKLRVIQINISCFL